MESNIEDMMDKKLCQSCGMPLTEDVLGTNANEQYYPGGVTDPNYCVLRFTATDGRFYSDFYPRSFVID